MEVFVAGASGATGKLLVEQLLDRGCKVKAIVRTPESLPDKISSNTNLFVEKGSILNLSDKELGNRVNGCQAVVSCLGHNLSFKGIYGSPRRLVTEATRRLCLAIKANQPKEQVRFLLMNTTANRNRDLNEPISMGQRIVISLLRLLLPPHPDNEQAAEFLRTQIGQTDTEVGWVAIRPDALIDQENVSDYTLHPSPTRDPIFDSGKTSRINVGHFMADLITKDDIWESWKGKMPIIYNVQEEVDS